MKPDGDANAVRMRFSNETDLPSVDLNFLRGGILDGRSKTNGYLSGSLRNVETSLSKALPELEFRKERELRSVTRDIGILFVKYLDVRNRVVFLVSL